MDTYLSSSDCMGCALSNWNGFGYDTESMACSIAGRLVLCACVNNTLIRSQTTGFVVTAAGYILGHSHKGRMFRGSAHGTFAWILLLPIITQLLLGIYLKLHLNDQSLRPWAVRVHGIVGKLYPILGWTQMLFGVNIFGDYCHSGDDLEVCLAHHIKASRRHFILNTS